MDLFSETLAKTNACLSLNVDTWSIEVIHATNPPLKTATGVVHEMKLCEIRDKGDNTLHPTPHGTLPYVYPIVPVICTPRRPFKWLGLIYCSRCTGIHFLLSSIWTYGLWGVCGPTVLTTVCMSLSVKTSSRNCRHQQLDKNYIAFGWLARRQCTADSL